MNNLNPNSSVPLYVQLKEYIREQITNETFNSDQPIPSTKKLCQQFVISPITVKRALSELGKEGMLFGKPGKGTFVVRNKDVKDRNIIFPAERGFSEKTYHFLTNGEVEIRFAGELGVSEEQTKKLLETFEKNHPDIKVKLEPGLGRGYIPELLTRFAADTAPDVFYILPQYGTLSQFADKGMLLPLGKYLDEDPEISREDFFEVSLKILTYKKTLYALPKDVNPLLLYYNKKLFDEAGVSYPDETWTWEDIYRASKKITRDTNGDGKTDIFGGGFDVGYYYTLALMKGKDIFNKDRTRCTLNDPEIIEALEFADRFRQEGLVITASETQSIKSYEYFATGKVGMYINGPYLMRVFNHYKDLDYDVAMLPGPTAKARWHEFFCLGYAINSKTKHPDAAWKLVKTLSGFKGSQVVASTKHGIPPIKKVAMSEIYLSPPPENMKAGIKMMKYGISSPAFPGCAKAREIINRNLEYVSVGEKTVKQVIPGIVKEVNKLLLDIKK